MNKYNISTMCKRGFNSPTVDGTPLYKNVEGYRGEGAINMSNVSDNYIKSITNRYTSPDNIRRLFISSSGIDVEYYKPIKGDKNASLSRNIKWAVNRKTAKGGSMLMGINMKSVVEDFQRWVVNGRGYNRQYELTGNPFKALLSPYVLQNIEEIYFDMTMLISSDIMNSGLSNVILKLITTRDSEFKDTGELERLFKSLVFGDENKDLRKQFPRLRAIGYVERLSELYGVINKKTGIDSIEDMQSIWFDNVQVKSAVKRPDNCVRLYIVKGTPKLNKEFSVKTGIYQYDVDVLKPFSESLKLRIDKYYESKRTKETDDRKLEAQKIMEKEKSAVEMILDNMYEESNGDESYIKSQVIALFLGRSISEREKELSLFSKEGKERYQKYLSKKR